LGVEHDELDELDEALTVDEQDAPNGVIGPRANGWLGRIVARLAGIPTDVMSGAGGVLVAQALTAYMSGPHPH
jgi:hypothetical protein